MSNKIRVYDVFDSISPYDGFDSIISSIEAAKKAEASGEWQQLAIDPDQDEEKWVIRGYREETDKEYQKRMKELEKTKEFKKKLKQDREERDKKEYERLKKKFGDK